MLFSFRKTRQCPAIVTAHTVGHIVIAEYRCDKRAEHEGFHRSKEGVTWDNTDKIRQHLDPAKRRSFLLG